MTENAPVVITTKQARQQINHLGRSLIIYIVLFSLLQASGRLTELYASDALENVDTDMVTLVASIVFILFVTLIPFTISAKKLKLDIKDYLKDPRLRIDRTIALICIGIGLSLVVTSISTLFYFFFHTESISYDWLGSFNTAENITKNILYFVFFVILEPLCDEYIFRGLIQRQLGHYGRYFGVIASAVLYAISRTNLVDALPAFVVGWYLSLITLRYHSIRPGIKVHLALSLFLWIVEIIPGNMIWLITIFIVLIYIFAGLFIFQKRVDTGMVRYGATEGKLWKILLTSPTIIACIVLFVLNIMFSLV